MRIWKGSPMISTCFNHSSIKMQWFRCLVWHFTVCFDIFRSSGSRSPSTVSLLGGEVGCFWQSMDDGNMQMVALIIWIHFGTWKTLFVMHSLNHLELGKPYLLFICWFIWNWEPLFLDSFGTWNPLFVVQQTSNQQWPLPPLANGTKWYSDRHWHIHRQARSLSLSRLSPGATLRPTTPTYGGVAASLAALLKCHWLVVHNFCAVVWCTV